jgi:hypothetical protein
MSAYDNDLRVEWPKLGWPPDVLAMIPDPTDKDGTRILMPTGHGGFVVKGNTNDDLSLRDPGDRYNRRLEVFATLDKAIAAVIGEPQ